MRPFICRDKNEKLKELTAEESRELLNKDRRDRPTYNSPRRERALKIYVDSSNKTG